MERRATTSGKIILSGEYAMAFGYPGIAVPSRETMTVRFTPKKKGGLVVIWGDDVLHPEWAMYAGQVAECIGRKTNMDFQGELVAETDLPLGKGMGSSTALVIAVAKALLGENCRDIALQTEDEMNPGHSGMDFAVIWTKSPVLFKKGTEPKLIDLPKNLLKKAELIDSGMPGEQTRELLAWVRSRENELQKPLATIGQCTERLLEGESLKTVMRDHHKAQMELGVVPRHAADIAREAEERGGAAKIIGAGGRTGGGGMVLVLS